MLLYAVRFVAVLRRSSASGVKAAKARRMLDLMSLGGSLDTLMHICKIDSGMIFACTIAAAHQNGGVTAVQQLAAQRHTCQNLSRGRQQVGRGFA